MHFQKGHVPAERYTVPFGQARVLAPAVTPRSDSLLPYIHPPFEALLVDAVVEGRALSGELGSDVLSELSAHRRDGQILVGFAAEAGEGAVAYGRGKLERKGLDAVVVNDIDADAAGE